MSPHYNGTRLPKILRRVWPKKCTTCSRSFSDVSKQCSVCGLAAHVWVHPNDGPDAQVWLVPRCHWCNQADGVKGRKIKPKWRKIEDPTFAVTIDEFKFGCEFCDEKFFSNNGAIQHERKAHPLKYKEKITLQSSGDSNRHINSVHNGQTDHKCDSCGKTFSRKDSLKTHINSIHNGQKDHKCDSCGKTFSRKDSLKTHINSIHNGLKDHECNSCGKAFSSAGNLKTHINSVHNSQKDYKCDTCGKEFSEARRLKTHLLVHEKRKPFKCNKCDETFARKDHLKRHIENVHEGRKDHRCNICGDAFAEKKTMTRHIERNHT